MILQTVFAIVGSVALMLTIWIWYSMMTMKLPADAKPATWREQLAAVILLFGPLMVSAVFFALATKP